MISIFEAEDTDNQATNGKMSIDRLRQVLGSQEDIAPRAPVSAAAPKLETTPVARPAESPSTDGNGVSSVSRPPAAPIPNFAFRAEPAISAEFQRFSEQFTRSFLEALGRAVSDIHELVVEDRRKVEAACNFISGASRDMEALRAQVASLSERFGVSASAQHETSVRLGKAEEALSAVSGVNESLQELRQAFGERLDVQADAIRTLHGAVEEREGHFEKLFAVFRALQDVAGSVSVSEKSLGKP